MGFGWPANRVHSVHDVEIDEVSLVDRPANQHAAMLIAKRDQGADMPPDAEAEAFFFLQDGTPVTEDMFTEGLTFFDAEGQQYVWTEEDDEAAAAAGQEEPALSKGAGSPFQPGAATGRQAVGKSLAETFRDELAKAQTGADISSVIVKMSGALDAADQRAHRAEELAKSEQDLRLTREYIAKAAEYNLPVTPEELGPVMKRCAELLPHADCVVLDKVFNAAGSMLFTELGFRGGGTPAGEDPMADAEAAVEAQLAKSAAGGTPLSKAQAIEAYYASRPDAYDEYLRTRG